MPMRRIETTAAPKAIGPYSQAIVTELGRGSHLAFVSGQLPIDPKTGKLVSGGIKEQTERVLDNIAAILASSGVGFDRVVKVEIFLKDLNDFAVMNEVYGSRFTFDIKPARQTVQVARLPMDSLIEISCTAFFELF